MTFSAILPTDPIYDQFAQMLDEARKPKNKFDYRELVAYYNKLPVGSIIPFPMSKLKKKYLLNRLKVAGLYELKDFDVYMDNETQEDGSEVMTAYLTKRSETKGGRLPLPGERKTKVGSEPAAVAAPQEAPPAPPPPPPPSRSVKGDTPKPPPKKTPPAKKASPPPKKAAPSATNKPARRSPPKA